jgi:hypothetical protein
MQQLFFARSLAARNQRLNDRFPGELVTRARGERLDLYQAQPWEVRHEGGPNANGTDGGAPVNLVARHFTAAATLWAPTYDATSRQIRRLGLDRHEHSGWRWIPDGDRLTLVDRIAVAPDVLTLGWQVPAWREPEEAAIAWPFWVVAALVLFLATQLVVAMARRVFGSQDDENVCALPPPDRGATHEQVWQSLSDQQKVVLWRLAKDRFINPRHWPIARALEARGLIAVDPAPRIADESWTCFLSKPEVMPPAATRARNGASRWSSMRMPLLVVALAVGLFFFFTQRDQANATLGFVTAITAAIPALLKLLGTGAKDGDAAHQ